MFGIYLALEWLSKDIEWFVVILPSTRFFLYESTRHVSLGPRIWYEFPVIPIQPANIKKKTFGYSVYFQRPLASSTIDRSCDTNTHGCYFFSFGVHSSLL